MLSICKQEETEIGYEKGSIQGSHQRYFFSPSHLVYGLPKQAFTHSFKPSAHSKCTSVSKDDTFLKEQRQCAFRYFKLLCMHILLSVGDIMGSKSSSCSRVHLQLENKNVFARKKTHTHTGIKPNIRLGYMKLMKQFYMDLILPAATEDILPKELTIDLK